MASLPDHVLDNQELLEGFALEAFEQAAAANLPALFPDATYKKRPELLEGGVNASWVMLPLRRPRYKRCSRTFNVTITPQMAEAIESFEGAPLSEYLQDQLGLPEGRGRRSRDCTSSRSFAGGTAADIARQRSGNARARRRGRSHALAAAAADARSGRGPAREARARPQRCRPGANVRTVRARTARLPHGGRTAAADRAGPARPATRAAPGARSTSISTAPNDQVARSRVPQRGQGAAARGSAAPADRTPARSPSRSRSCWPKRCRRSCTGGGRAGCASCIQGVAPGADSRRLGAAAGGSCRRCSSPRCRSGSLAAFAEFAKNEAAEVPRRRQKIRPTASR